MREEIVEWIISHNNFKPSCVSSGVINILSPESYQKEVFLKMLTEIYVRDIHDDMIKKYYNVGLESVVDSMTQKLLISYTTLILFIPPQVSKIIIRLRQICGCEIFIIS